MIKQNAAFFFKLILKEFKNNPFFNFLFVLSLSLGLIGFLVVDVFEHSLHQTLSQRSKSILGADLALSSRQPISKKQRQIVFKESQSHQVQESQMIQTYSMISGSKKRSRLMNIVAIDAHYPFYGQVQLLKSENQTNLHSSANAWVHSETLSHLQSQYGDSIFIGEKKFKISGQIKIDSAVSMAQTLAPKIYISKKYLEETKLIQFGSLATYIYLYKIPGKDSSELRAIRDRIFDQLQSPEIQIYTHENSSETMGRMVNYLNDFLSLASLCALFLSCVSLCFLFNSYLKSKTKEVAILLSLGVQKLKASFLYVIHICFLGFLSFLFSITLSILLLPIFKIFVNQFIPIDIAVRFNTVNISFFLFCIIPVMICIPFITQIRNIQPRILLSEIRNHTLHYDTFFFISWIPVILGLWLMAVIGSNSWVTGSIFIGCLLVAIIFLSLAALLILFLLKKFNKFSSNSLRWAFRDLYKHPVMSLSCFLALSIGVLLTHFIPQMQMLIASEITSPHQKDLPNFFIFNINEDQKKEFENFIQNKNIKINKIMPMIQSRLVMKNDQPFDKGEGYNLSRKTREHERRMRFRNRTFNLSYQDFSEYSEDIAKGQWFKENYNKNSGKLVSISLEKRFARRLNFKVGDTLTFDIIGKKFKGVVESIRNIHWLSFEPNFFIVFQKGFLDHLPKTFVASIAGISSQTMFKIQNDIVDRFPNISIINIAHIKNTLISFSHQMMRALQLMTLLCVLAGFVVLYSISSHQSRLKKWDVGLLKVLGASFSEVNKLFLYQFGWLTLFAATFGLMGSYFMSYMFAVLTLKTPWVSSTLISIFLLISVVIVSLGITHLATRKSLKTPPKHLLNS